MLSTFCKNDRKRTNCKMTKIHNYSTNLIEEEEGEEDRMQGEEEERERVD